MDTFEDSMLCRIPLVTVTNIKRSTVGHSETSKLSKKTSIMASGRCLAVLQHSNAEFPAIVLRGSITSTCYVMRVM